MEEERKANKPFHSGLVDLTLPSDSDPGVRDPPLSALNGGSSQTRERKVRLREPSERERGGEGERRRRRERAESERCCMPKRKLTNYWIQIMGPGPCTGLHIILFRYAHNSA